MARVRPLSTCAREARTRRGKRDRKNNGEWLLEGIRFEGCMRHEAVTGVKGRQRGGWDNTRTNVECYSNLMFYSPSRLAKTSRRSQNSRIYNGAPVHHSFIPTMLYKAPR